MSEPFDTFSTLDVIGQRAALIKVCELSLQVWEEYCEGRAYIPYTDSVVGTSQSLDCGLPRRALLAVGKGIATPELREQYLEPITALQDDDLDLPKTVEFAYYSIYNLYKKCCLQEDVGAGLIIKQGLAAHN